jgi:hypothetical protein
MLTRIFGTVVDMKKMSEKDRLERKKYTGVCRWKSDDGQDDLQVPKNIRQVQ